MGISEYFCEAGIPYYRGQDIHDFFIENANPICIPKSVFAKPVMKRSHLKKNDVLLSIVGTIGEVSLVNTDSNATCSCKLAILRPNASLRAGIIALFLQSKYGYTQIRKFIRGAVQMGFILEDVNQIIIPNFSDLFQTSVEQVIKTAQLKLNESKSLFIEAEDILLSELGLKNWEPKNQNVSIKHFSDFFETGRLDAEYYQSKYDEFNEKLYKNPSLKCVLAEEVCSDINYGTVPTSPYTTDGTGIPYIKGMNLKNTEIITDNLDRITNTGELPDKFYTKKGDIIISQMGTVADVGVVTENEVGYLFASFTIRLRLKKDCLLQPYYVGLYIQKVAKKWYFYRNIAQASVRQNTDLPTVRNLPIPIISETAQNLIAEKIQKSFDLRKQSKDLLEQAKRMVENEIEKVNIS